MLSIAMDESSWCSTQQYPDTVTCRRMVALGDMIADPKPTALWWTWKAKFFNPELSNRQIAEVLGIDDHTVARNLANIRLTVDCFLPKSVDDEWQELMADMASTDDRQQKAVDTASPTSPTKPCAPKKHQPQPSPNGG